LFKTTIITVSGLLFFFFIFTSASYLKAQGDGLCRPLAKVCHTVAVGGRADKTCYEGVAHDILSNSSQCADIWLKSLSVRDKQILALINVANEYYWPVEDEYKFNKVDKILRSSLGTGLEELQYSSPSNAGNFAEADYESFQCPEEDEVREFLSCTYYELSKNLNDRADWDDKDWVCFIDRSFRSEKTKSKILSDFKSAPADLLAKMGTYRGCSSQYGLNGRCEFTLMVREALGQIKYFESIIGRRVEEFPYGPSLTSIIFLPNEGPPRLVNIERCKSLLLLDYDDMATTELSLYLSPPQKMKDGAYYSQVAEKIEIRGLN